MEHLWQGQPSNQNQEYYSPTYTAGIDLTQFGHTMEEQTNYVSSQAYTLDEHTTPVGDPSQSNNPPKKKQRNSNYNPTEDEVLISAYLNVSKDAAVGTNQSGKSYWKRISEYYDEHKKTPLTRSKDSLERRWGDIQKDTTKFCSFYEKILRLHQSGKSDDDKVKDALQMYSALEKKPFKFLHCWILLRHEQKWTTWLASLEANANEENHGAEDGSREEQDTVPEAMVRPMGRDKTKKLRSASTASNSTACFEMLQKFQQDRAKYKEQIVDQTSQESRLKLELKERQVKAAEDLLKLQQESQKLAQQERDERIINMDLEKVAPWARDYYAKMQQVIMARALAENPGN